MPTGAIIDVNLQALYASSEDSLSEEMALREGRSLVQGHMAHGAGHWHPCCWGELSGCPGLLPV